MKRKTTNKNTPAKKKTKKSGKHEETIETRKMAGLKLLVDKRKQKVLFAEAGKDFVDFLFSILSLPIGAVIGLLTKKGMVGCLANLYRSVEDLDDTYMQPDSQKVKDRLLKPGPTIAVSTSTEVPPLLSWIDNVPPPPPSPEVVPATLYKCTGGCYCAKLFSGNVRSCPNRCGYTMSTVVTDYYVAAEAASAEDPGKPAESGGGFVKGVVTYMVMDDLVVEPMSTISSISLLNKFNIKDVGALQEMVVRVGIDEGLRLLKSALSGNSVLTDVFLKN